MSQSRRQALGHWGETQAVEHLKSRGYVILECNARTPYGEIDIVARTVEPDGEMGGEGDPVVVFVEVKTRSTRTFGLPEESVTARKREHMIAAAQAYLQNHPELVDAWRIDVIAIQIIAPGNSPSIYHFENAIQ